MQGCLTLEIDLFPLTSHTEKEEDAYGQWIFVAYVALASFISQQGAGGVNMCCKGKIEK